MNHNIPYLEDLFDTKNISYVEVQHLCEPDLFSITAKKIILKGEHCGHPYCDCEYENIEIGTLIPDGTLELTFCEDFNEEINDLPNSLTHLKFGRNFNKPINYLPINLTHLTFHYRTNFNQPVDNLPNNLTHLELWGDFNQELNHLPDCLIYLALGPRFTKKLSNLPLSIKTIRLHEHYCEDISFLYDRGVKIIRYRY